MNLAMNNSHPMRRVRALALAAAATLAAASPAVRAQAEAQGHDSLPALLARALPNDPQVRVAQTLLLVNDERRKQARSRLAPNLAVTVSQGSSAVSETGLLGFNDFDRNTQRSDVALRWNLYNAGNDQAELRASATDLGAAEQDLRRAHEESAERIAQAYLDLLRIDELLPRMRARLASVQRLVALVRQQNDAGKASDADLQQAQAYLLDAEIAADQLEGERDSSRQRLLRLTGEAIVAAVPVVLPDVLADQPPAESLGQPGRTGLQAAALLRAQAARERVRPWLSLAAPRVDLELRKALSDRTSPQVTTLEHHGWAISVRWDLPLGGETLSRRTEAQRRAEAAEAEAERTEQGIRTELDALLPRLDSARRSVVRLAGQIDQYRALIRAGELQFEAGRRTLAQIIQLHDSLYSAEQHRSDQAYQLQVGQLRKLSLTGALLPALLGPNAPG
jgi:outer membrane protein TolC